MCPKLSYNEQSYLQMAAQIPGNTQAASIHRSARYAAVTEAVACPSPSSMLKSYQQWLHDRLANGTNLFDSQSEQRDKEKK